MPIKKIQVCHGPTCSAHGAARLKSRLETSLQGQGVDISERGCCGRCRFHNTIIVDNQAISNLSVENISESFLHDPEAARERGKKEETEILQVLDDFLTDDKLF